VWGVFVSFSRSAVIALAVGIAFGVAGCSPATGEIDRAADGRPTSKPVADDEPTDPGKAKPRQTAGATVTRWVCSYDPTFNRDWHDDVMCSKGKKHLRPYLRPKDRFVTKDEIMRSAHAYEDRLNARA
jgi:hypothetical protein